MRNNALDWKELRLFLCVCIVVLTPSWSWLSLSCSGGANVSSYSYLVLSDSLSYRKKCKAAALFGSRSGGDEHNVSDDIIKELRSMSVKVGHLFCVYTKFYPSCYGCNEYRACSPVIAYMLSYCSNYYHHIYSFRRAVWCWLVGDAVICSSWLNELKVNQSIHPFVNFLRL